jgi:iron-sulfur cluster repair protein YtfE (RIC family)
MAQACQCGCGHSGAEPATSPVRPEQTVEEVSHRSPEALAVLQELGINHCCGAHLTLAEAAAAAGVPLDQLLARLAQAAAGVAAPAP